MPAENAVQLTVSYHGLDHDEETVEVEPGTSFDAFLRERDIHPETVLVFLDGDVVPEQTEIPPEADVRILRIISGGEADKRPKR
jgi:sulfur carrier protein ThiS